jgi:hypothetical protein
MNSTHAEGPRGRILVADTAVGAQMAQNIFRDEFDLVHARSLEQAVAALDRRLVAVLCGLHFDGSRMFDLLRAISSRPFRLNIPVICYRDLESDLGAAVIEGLEIATAAMGALAFVDSYTLKQRYGIPHGDEVIRSYVLYHTWQPPVRDVDERASRGPASPP